MNKKYYSKGFTLVELSIVIIIIGLIVGGVVGGQSLVRSAEVQSVIKDYTKYTTAAKAFKLEYDSLPGDFSEAEDYWGAGNTNNGDNNRKVNYGNEMTLFWQHMSLAEIIPGEFQDTHCTGSVNPGTCSAYADFSSSVGWFAAHNENSNFSTGGTCGKGAGASTAYSNYASSMEYMLVLVKDTPCSTFLKGPLAPKEVKKIDKKIDDGEAERGIFIVPDDSNNCVNSASNYDYVLTNDNRDCLPVFIVK